MAERLSARRIECSRFRFVDMLHMGFVDEVLFGRDVIEEMPRIVAEWVELERNRLDLQPGSG